MGQTVRRQPGEVDIPSKDYIYHKNLIGFKGLDTRENPLVTDPLSCSDAENVWVDANGNLTTRPRLEYVRQNLKHTDAEVANVIYTDNAYWTLYIKGGVYYLTRTDLATSVEHDFTIPTLTSAKIAITEYKNVYYLGCSAGYYSCNASFWVFEKISGYIPVGHLGESGYIYDEARNILNSQIRTGTVGALTNAVFPPRNYYPIGSFGPYLVYQPYEEPKTTAIWDIRTGNVVKELLGGVDKSCFTVFATDTEAFIAYADGRNDGIHVYIYYCSWTDAELTVTSLYNAYPYSICGGPLLHGDDSKQNTFCGYTGTQQVSVDRVYWSTQDSHVLANITYKYLQWDYANADKRGGYASGLTIDTGQFCEEALQIDVTGLLTIGTFEVDTDKAERAGYIRRIGLRVYPEHTQISDRPYLYHLSLVGTETPAENYACVPISNGKCIACNTAQYSKTKDGVQTGAKVYVAGFDALTTQSYPRPDMTYKSVTAISSIQLNKIVNITGTGLHDYSIYTLQSNALLRYDVGYTEFDGGGIYVSDAVSIITGELVTAGIARESQAPFMYIADNKILYRIPKTRLADLSGITVTGGFFAAAGIIIFSTGSVADMLTAYAYSTQFDIELNTAYTPENPSIRGVLFLDNVYWWFGKTTIYGTANEDLTYMPESRKLDAPSEIRNWVRLTDTSFLVFCESDTCLYYKDTSSGLWLRTVLNLPFEILYPDETSESCYAALNTGPTYVTRNGIYEIALSENLFTNERQAQNISDPLTTLQGGLLRKLIPNITHLQTVRYKDWQLYIFTRANATKTEVIAQEITTYNFFYWTLPIVFQAVYLAHSQVYLVTKKATTYTFSEAELLREYKNGSTVLAAIKCYGDEVYDTVKKTTSLNQIDWHWHSAVINLDTVQYYKTLLALIFGMNDYDDESRIMFEYRTDIYYKSHTEQPTQVYDDYVYKIRATQKPMAIPRFMYIRVRISSVKVPENEDCLPEEFMCKANLSQLTFKYKVLRGPLL